MPVTAATFLPAKACTIEKTPNTILPETMRQAPDVLFYGVQGIETIAGDITLPLFPSNGMALWFGALGIDGGVTGSSPTNSTTTNGAVLAGGTSVTLTSATGWSGSVVFQIGTGATAEVHNGTVSGSTVTLAGSETFLYPHADLSTIAKVSAPYTHTAVMRSTGQLSSFTVEKNMGGNNVDIQYAGSIVGKAVAKFTTNAEPEVTYTLMAQKDLVLSSATSPSWPTDAPYSPTQIAVSTGGVVNTNITSAEVTVDNMGKNYPTLNGYAFPGLVVGTTRRITAKFTAIMTALNGGAGSQGYYADLYPITATELIITATNGSNVYTLTLPAAYLTKYSDPIKIGDLIMVDLEYTAIMGGGSTIDAAFTQANTYITQY